MSNIRSIDKGLGQNLLFSLPMFEGTGSATLMDAAKPHHPVLQESAPVWTQLSPSGLWTLDLDGTSDYLWSEAADTTDLNFTTGDFSGCCWVYPDSTGSTIFFARGLLNTDGWEFCMESPGSLRLQWFAPGLNYAVCANGTVTASAWQLLGFSRSGLSATTVRCYRNGADVVSSTNLGSNPATASRKLLVGVRNDEVSWALNGKIWGVRIWGRALSPAEHRTIFQSERGWFGV